MRGVELARLFTGIAGELFNQVLVDETQDVISLAAPIRMSLMSLCSSRMALVWAAELSPRLDRPVCRVSKIPLTVPCHSWR